MKLLRAGCICNPDAAGNRRLLPRLRPRLERLASSFYAETKSSKDFAQLLHANRVEELDLLVLSGGDGSMQQGLTALLSSGARRFPALALLPAGSTNVAATDLGGEADLEAAVSALEVGLPSPRTVSRSPLIVTPDGADDTLVGLFLGVGAAPLAVSRYREIRKPVRGLPFLDAGASVLAIGGTALEIGLRGNDWRHGLVGEVCVDGRSTGIEESSLMIISCLDGLFKGVSPWWQQGDKTLRYLQLGLDAPDLVRNLPGILRGRPSVQVKESPLYASGGADLIELPPVAHFTIDGELFRTAEGHAALRVEAGPKLRFVRYL